VDLGQENIPGNYTLKGSARFDSNLTVGKGPAEVLGIHPTTGKVPFSIIVNEK